MKRSDSGKHRKNTSTSNKTQIFDHLIDTEIECFMTKQQKSTATRHIIRWLLQLQLNQHMGPFNELEAKSCLCNDMGKQLDFQVFSDNPHTLLFMKNKCLGHLRPQTICKY